MKRGLPGFSAILVCALFSCAAAQVISPASYRVGGVQDPNTITSVAGKVPAQESRVLSKTLSIQSRGVTIRYPDKWIVPPRRFVNADELIYSQKKADGSIPGNSEETLSARIMITTEQGREHTDALRRLKEIEAEVQSPSTYLSIGTWPALQRRTVAIVPRPGRPFVREEDAGMTEVLRITTAIAAGNMLIRLEGSMPPEAASELADEVELVGRSTTFSLKGEPGQAEREIERLRTAPSLRSTLVTPQGKPSQARPGTAEPRTKTAIPLVETPRVNSPRSSSRGGRQDIDVGVPQRILQSGAEIEVAASSNGQNIVVATNGGFTFSNNGGASFFAQTGLPFPMGFFRTDGDPSLAVGRSGTFYYAIIGYPAGNAPTNTATSMATAIYTSATGQNFAYLSNAVVCNGNFNFNTGKNTFPNPGDCFADQEHIAADRVNAGMGGGDQVYSTWRNFDSSDQDPALRCSQDGGQTWLNNPTNVGSGFVPRINVGQDGTVYVVYRASNNIMLQRYSSCASGLAAQGMPSMIASVTDVCPPNGQSVPGIDRCDGRNVLSSHLVAVDDTNANHVYAAYATHTGNGNENIIVRDSTDGGVSWPAANMVQVNAATTGRRYMPWVCAIGGTAHVTWYDGRAATAANNDLTDFFRGSASRTGGNLVAGTEVKITTASDPHCQTGFPCSSDNSGDAESCSVQPQLWGICKLNPLPNPDTSSNTPCDFNQTACPTNEVCTTFGGGCPKFGDYNGNTCSAGRIYSAWASSTSYAGITPPTPSNRIDTFFQADVVCCVPVISAPASVTLPDTCAGDTGTTPLTVTNMGFTDLVISGIISNNPLFSVSDSFPKTIAAGSSFTFTVKFSPLTRGMQFATLTINSNDPVTPVKTVSASGLGKGLQSINCPPDLTVGNDPGLCSAVVNPGNPTVLADGCPVNITGLRSDGKPLTDPYPVGMTTIKWTATDGGGNAQSCNQQIVVKDVEPPVISATSALPSFISQPLHDPVTVTISYNVMDNCDPIEAISCNLSVTAKEPLIASGDGNSNPEWDVIDPHHLRFKPNPQRGVNAHIYTILITCTDTKGNSSNTGVSVSSSK